MALLRQLPLQRRQRLLDLRHHLSQHVRPGDLAGVELGAQQLEYIVGDLDEFAGGVDPSAQRRFLNGIPPAKATLPDARGCEVT